MRRDAPFAAPRLGAVAGFGIAADHRRLRLGAANPHIVGVRFHQAVEDFIARQAKDVIHAIGLAPRHHLGTAVMTVASDGQPGVGPMLSDTADQAAQMVADFYTGRRCAGP